MPPKRNQPKKKKNPSNRGIKPAAQGPARMKTKASGALQVNPKRKSYGTSKSKISVPRMLSNLPALHECAARYMASICDPWSPQSKGACVPFGTTRETQKVTVFSRATATVGTAGVGFAAFAPCLANDQPSLFCTGAAYTGTTALPTTVIAGIPGVNANVSQTPHNGPYGRARFLPTSLQNAGTADLRVAGRVVSAGISAQYTGTVSNMGGLLYCLTTPNHTNLHEFSPQNMGSFVECEISRVDDMKCMMVDVGHTSNECEFPDLATYMLSQTTSSTLALPEPTVPGPVTLLYPFARGTRALNSTLIAEDGTNTYGSITSLIMFTGTPGNTFQIEVIMHLEYIGLDAQANATPVHKDTDGFNMVQEAAMRAPMIKASQGINWKDACLKALSDVGRELGPVALKAGTGLLMSLL